MSCKGGMRQVTRNDVRNTTDAGLTVRLMNQLYEVVQDIPGEILTSRVCRILGVCDLLGVPRSVSEPMELIIRYCHLSI